jgi:hypothetical protein
MILTFMIRKGKRLELMKNNYNPFEHICFTNAFDLKNYGFENVTLTKIVHIFYMVEGMNA